jgi:hypothetical protein
MIRKNFIPLIKTAIPAKTTIYPTRATMWHGESLVTAGNPLAITGPGPHSDVLGQVYLEAPLQHPPANGDTFTQSFQIATGTYTLYIMGAGDANNGKVQWYLDDIEIGTLQDWYTSGPVYALIMTIADIVIANSGRHVLKGMINGCNPSSINGYYYLPLTKYWVTPEIDTSELEEL